MEELPESNPATRDPETGEMIFFAYSAAGRFSPTLAYGVIDHTGKLTRYDQFDAPYASMVYDFLVTQNYVLFPVLPLTGSMQRAMAGKPAYAWEADKRSYVGVMKRNAEVSSIRWFECVLVLRSILELDQLAI